LNEAIILAKKTVKTRHSVQDDNHSFLPGGILDVSTDGEFIIQCPLQKRRADEVRAQLARLEIDDQDVTAAVSWGM
jgi:hypothetical protein